MPNISDGSWRACCLVDESRRPLPKYLSKLHQAWPEQATGDGAGWDFLVNPVRCVRAATSATMPASRPIVADYGGSLRRLRDTARDAKEVEQRLLDFHGIAPVTANIFLRELRPFWVNANPDPLPCVRIGETPDNRLSRYRRSSITFVRLEAGLIRRRHELAG